MRTIDDFRNRQIEFFPLVQKHPAMFGDNTLGLSELSQHSCKIFGGSMNVK